ncbi:MAG: LamG domain-containing protein [Candidatus Poribacteria bacterium]
MSKDYIIIIIVLFLFGIFVLCSASYAEIDIKTIVGAWLFEEGSGKTVKDYSGKGNEGKIFGNPKWVNGKFGKAMEFNGETDYIVIKDSDSLDLDLMTVSAWINLSKYADDQRIVAKEEGVNDPYSVYCFLISGTNDKKIEFRPTLDGKRQRIESKIDIPLGQWINVSATYDGKEVALYVNGEVDTKTSLTGKMMVNDKDLWIGASEFWTPRFFNGIMDEVVLFSVPLSESDIKSLMTKGLGIKLSVSNVNKLISTWSTIKSF